MLWSGGNRVGLALGGGAARGLAHLGVLRVLVREQVPIDLVVGTSMGSVIGGAWAATRQIDQLESQIRRFLESEDFRKLKFSFLKESKQQRGGLLYSVSNLVRRGIVYGTSTLRGSFISAENFARSLGSVLPDVPIETNSPHAASAASMRSISSGISPNQTTLGRMPPGLPQDSQSVSRNRSPR